MYKTELIEGITVNNAVDKIDKKIIEMEKARLTHVIFRSSKGCARF